MTGSGEFRGVVKRLSVPLSLLLFVIVFGSVGYYWLWREYDGTLLDAVYMTFITVTTVGYNEIHPLGSVGRVFTILVAMTGIASLFYMFSAVMESLVARQLRDPYGRRKMERTVAALQNHVILAGFGRMGHRVAEELHQEGTPFVVVDNRPESEAFAAEHGYLLVRGDAEEDEVLEKAGVKRARALIAATGSDAANAFIVMSARGLNGDLLIVARADEDAAIRKLQKAGADQILNPYAIAGHRLVNMVLRPAALDFISRTLRSRGSELGIEDFSVPATSPFINKSLKDLALRNRSGVNIVAVIRDGTSIPNPAPDFDVEAGDHLVVLGTSEQFATLRHLANEALTEALP
ncbi:potassium channel protein [soil metagenome]